MLLLSNDSVDPNLVSGREVTALLKSEQSVLEAFPDFD